MKWLDNFPLGSLTVVAVMLAIMPAIFPPHPEPHLVEKIGMLLDGTLRNPLDIFDLFLHGTPITLLFIKIVRRIVR
ncbi:MAG: RND transporter [Thiotrichales bacterium]|jgi:hypothetical protein|nr:RND transporter [Thiotrichales bacterium]MBT3613100.1 RND transporter [Thiotrichales bacterium]MBT3752143.1 RND transporter [Thiotrichales bacterium]MBT3837815.1 RND transporter [Thiotrichales bacterium]MBT4152770.1 RND transporter [Thiotrichales bacterium]